MAARLFFWFRSTTNLALEASTLAIARVDGGAMLHAQRARSRGRLREKGNVMHVLLVGPDLEANLSLGYLASSLARAGHSARIVAFNDGGDVDRVLAHAPAADLIGLSMCFQVRAPQFLELAELLKEARPGVPVIAGGHFATCAAHELMRDYPQLDVIVMHEGEHTIVELADLGDELIERAASIPGVVARVAGRPHASAARPILRDLDTLPLPDRSGPARLVAGVPTAYMMGARGCIRSCDYCCITTLHRVAPGPRFRRRDPDLVVGEMAELYHRRGVRQFVFHDDNFLVPNPRNNLERLGRYQRAIDGHELRDIGLVMKCGPQDLDEASLVALREMGLLRIFLGIESGSQCGLDSIGRKQTTVDTERAVSLCEQHGVSSQYTMIIFNPEATIDSMLADLDFVDRHPAHPLNYCRAEIYAGTPLEQRMVESGRSIGSYMARTYRYDDDRVARVWRLGSDLFAGRCWGRDDILGQAIRLDHQVSVLRHFYDEGEVGETVRRFGAWQVRLNLETAALFRELVVACGEASADDDPALTAALESLRRREIDGRRAQLAELCDLRQRIDRCVAPIIEMARSRQPVPRIPRRAPRHAAAVLIAAGLLGCPSPMRHDHGVAEAAPPPYDDRMIETEPDAGPPDAAPPADAATDVRVDDGVMEAPPPPLDPVREDEGVAEAAPPPYDDRVRFDKGVAEAAPPPYEMAEPGLLTVASKPSTHVFIDGRAHGDTPLMHVKLKPGAHLLRMVNKKEGIDMRRKIIVKPGQEVRLILDLRKSK